jgi:hypothetical protein
MKKLILAFAATITLAGCVAPRTQIAVSEPFDEIATRELIRDGAGAVKGSALFRQQGGGVVTCAGFPVSLFPVTPYSRARMVALYGDPDGGYNPGRNPIFVPDPPAYAALARSTQCDAQGFFKFDRLPAGDFYVAVPILWQIGGARQGGFLSTRIVLKEGEAREIVLAR